MSKTIDERVVSMEFDNRHFEANVKTTLSTLDKLKQSLNLTGASKGLENVGIAAKKVDMNPLNSAVEGVRLKFSALEVMGITALTNITNSAINAGKRIVSALTIDPIKTGLQEYETQINAVQTILANTQSKGTTLDDVNAALDELNTYADKTIYNFTEMTRNIGTFTAAGVELDTSVAAIKGIANLAAISGSTSQQASTAMYQLSQALASGTVKLMDWNSVVNAGMGGQVFQDAIKETARVHGVAIDDMIKSEGSFRETLKDGWLTSDILLETLSKFTGDLTEEQLKAMGYTEEQVKGIVKLGETANDAATKVKTFTQLFDTLKEAAQSGWTQTWELLIGDFEEAKTFLTELSDVFGGIVNSMSESRNTLLGGALINHWEQFSSKIDEAGISMDDFQTALGAVAKTHHVSLERMIKENGSLQEAIENGKIKTEWLSEALKAMTGDLGGQGQWDYYIKKLDEAGVSTEHFQAVLSEVAKTHHISIDRLIRENGSLEAAFQNGKLSIGLVAETIRVLSGEMDGAAGSAAAVTGKFGDLEKVVNRVINGGFGNGPERVKALTEAGYDYTKVQELVNKVLAGEAVEFEKLTDAQIKSLGYTDEQVEALRALAEEAEKTGTPLNDLIESMTKPSGRELLINSLRNSLEAVGKVIKTVQKAWSNVFSPVTSNQLYTLIEKFHEFTEALIINDETARKLQNVFEGLFSVLKVGKDVAVSVISVGTKLAKAVFTPLAKSVLDAASALGTFVKSGTNSLSAVFQPFSASIETVIELLGKFAELVGEVFNKVTGFIGDSVSEWVAKIEETEVFKEFAEWFHDGAKSIEETLDTLTTRIREFDISGITNKFSNVQSFFSELVSTLKQNTFVANVMNEISDAFSGFIRIVKEFNFKIPKLDLSVFNNIANHITANDFSGPFGIILGAIDYFKKTFLLKFTAKMNSIKTDLVTAFGDFYIKYAPVIKEGIAKLKELVLHVVDFIFDTKQLKLPDILELLEKLLTIKLLLESIRVVGNVTSSVESVATGIEQLGKSLKWQAVAQMFKAMAVAMGTFTLCLYAINEMAMDAKTATTNVGILGGLIVAIGGIAALLTWLSTKINTGVDMLATTGSILALAASLGILVYALKEIDSAEWTNIKQSFTIMTGTLLAMSIAIGIVGKLCGGTTIKAAAAIITMLTAVKMIPSLLTDYAEFPWNSVKKAIPQLVSVLLGLALVLRIASRTTDGSTSGSALLLISMVVSIKLLMSTIEELGAMNSAQMWKGIAAVLAILGGMTAALAILSAVNKGSTILEKGQRSVNNFTGLATALLATAGAIWIFGKMDNATLLKGGAAVVTILGMFTVMLSTIGKATSGGIGFGSITGMIIGMGIVLAELAIVMKVLEDIDGKNAILQFTAMSELMLAMAATFALFKLIKIDIATIAETIIAIGTMAIFVAGLSEVLKAISDLNGTNAIEQVTAMSILLLAMSGCLAILSKIGYAANAAYPAMAALGVFITGLWALLSLIGGFNELTNGASAQALDSAIVIMEKLGLAIGKFVGGIIGGVGAAVLEAISSTLPKLGSDLSSFMTNASAFFSGLEQIDASMIAKAGFLSGIITTLIGISVINGLTNLLSIGKSLPNLGHDLSDFMINGSYFFESMKSISPRTASAAKNLAETIKILTEASMLDGIARLVGLDKSFAEFGENIAVFGTSLVGYSESVKDLTDSDIDRISKSAEAGKILSELAKNIPNSGGVAGWLFGDNDLDKFGNSIAIFGEKLVEYSDVIADFEQADADKVKMSAVAASSLSDLAASIPNDGGAAGWLFGENNIATFGDSIVEFGGKLIEYVEAISGLSNADADMIKISAAAASSLSELANNIPNDGGAISWLFGDNNIATFGTSIAAFGKSLMSYAESVSSYTDADTDNIKRSVEGATALNDVANTIEQTKGGLWNAVAGTTDLSGFGTGMSAIATGITDYATAAENITDDKIAAIVNSKLAIEAMDEVADVVDNTGGLLGWLVGTEDLSGFANGMINVAKGIVEYVQKVSGITPANIDSIKNSKEAVKYMGKASDEIPNKVRPNNVITMFGTGMVSLGEHIHNYISKVKSISNDGLVGIDMSRMAINKMASAAKALPNEGGLIALIAGDNNDANKFGEGMFSLAGHVLNYIRKVSGIDDEDLKSIERSKDAIKKMASAAKALPNDGGLISLIAGDNNDADKFGEGIVSLAGHVQDYVRKANTIDDADIDSIKLMKKAVEYMVDTVKAIPEVFSSDDGRIQGAISNLGSLTTTIKQMAGLNTENLTSLTNGLMTLGQNGVSSFVNAFETAGPKVSTAISGMMSSALTAMNNKRQEFVTIGRTFVSNLESGMRTNSQFLVNTSMTILTNVINTLKSRNVDFNTIGQSMIVQITTGIRTKSVTVSDEVNLVLTKVLTRIKNKYSEFSSAGQTLMIQLINGVRSKSDGVSSAFTSNLSGAVSSINSYYSNFYSAGRYLVQGFAAGIDDYSYIVEDAAADMAYDAYRAAMKELQAHSPSRLFREVGTYVPLGFALGIQDEQKTVENSTTSMVDSVINNTKNVVARIADAINSDIDTQPTIRPVLDLTDVKTKANQLNVMFSRTQAMSISSRMNKTSVGEDQNGEIVPTGGATYSFTQNNYSPKALSRSEIYRQTKNQFAAIERVVPV